MIRRCNGGPTGTWCGRHATVVCTEREDGPHPLQWYACDEPEHHGDAVTEPLAAWLARNGLPPPAVPAINKPEAP